MPFEGKTPPAMCNLGRARKSGKVGQARDSYDKGAQLVEAMPIQCSFSSQKELTRIHEVVFFVFFCVFLLLFKLVHLSH